ASWQLPRAWCSLSGALLQARGHGEHDFRRPRRSRALSPVTLNNYGGTRLRSPPAWVKRFLDTDNPPRPAARAIRSLKAEEAFGDGVKRPYLHLVDGGVADNVGMRAVLDSMEVLEALHEAGVPTQLDNTRRIVVFVVNSLSSPPTQ